MMYMKKPLMWIFIIQTSTRLENLFKGKKDT